MVAHLATLFGQIAEENGLAFYNGDKYLFNSTISQTPALWMVTPEKCSLSGTDNGAATYLIQIYIIELIHNPESENRERIWDQMEQTVINIVNKLNCSAAVNHVSGLSMTYGHDELVNSYEMHLGAQFKLQVVNIV